jgi:hypothetical protein
MQHTVSSRYFIFRNPSPAETIEVVELQNYLRDTSHK